MRDRDGEQRSLELLLPEGEKILQRRKIRKQIVILPDVGLQQRGMIRHAIENLRRGQPVTHPLLPKVLGNPTRRNHANLHLRSAFTWWPPTGATPAEMRSHERNVTHDTNPSQA